MKYRFNGNLNKKISFETNYYVWFNLSFLKIQEETDSTNLPPKE